MDNLEFSIESLELTGNGIQGNGLSGNGIPGNGLLGNGISGNGIEEFSFNASEFQKMIEQAI